MRYFFQLGALIVLAVVFYGCHSQPGERQLQQGMQALERGEYVQAKSALQQAINERPGSAANDQAYNLLGLANWHLGELQNAIEAFREARRLNPDFFEPLYNLGLIMLEVGEQTEAITLLETASQVNAKDTRALEYLAVIHLQEGRREEARRVLFEALGRAPGSPRILTSIANIEYELGQSEQAKHRWMAALESDSRYAPALFNIAWVSLTSDDDIEDAAAHARDFFDLDTDRHQTRRLRRAMLEARASRETQPRPAERPGLREKSPDELIEEARAIAEEDPPRALHLCFDAAGIARRAGDKATERRAYETAVQILPEQPRAHFALGRMLMEQNNLRRAQQSLLQATELRPDWVEANRLLAECAIKQRDFDVALVALQRIMKRQDTDQEALWMLAELHDRHLRRPADAVRAYRRFETLYPGDPRIFRAAERIKALETDARDAAGTRETASDRREPRRESADVPPTTEPSRTTPTERTEEQPRPAPERQRVTQPPVDNFARGVQLQQAGREREAIEAYLAAAAAGENAANAFFNLGVIYGRRGDHGRAQQAYERAIRHDPTMERARYNLALLHFNRQQFSQATTQLNSILQRNPRHAQSHFLMGRILARQPNRQQDARRHYEQFLRLAPDDPNAPAIRRWLQQN